MAAPKTTAKTNNNMRTTTTTPIGILPHSFFLRQLVLVSVCSSFSEKLCSVDNKEAEDESEGSAGTWAAVEYVEVTVAAFPVWVSGRCGGSRAGVTGGNKGTDGRAGAEKEAALSGDTGDTGVLNGSSVSTTGSGAGITRVDALASAAREALVGPSSGYLE